MLTCHILPPNDPTTPPPFFSSENKKRGRKGRKNGGRADEDWFRSFPSEQFQALLTLFSKFFASFPRGTCTLSGFGRCLALDGSYRPRLGLHSQAVRLYKEQTLPHFEFFCYLLSQEQTLALTFYHRPRTGLSPSLVPLSREDFGRGPKRSCN